MIWLISQFPELEHLTPQQRALVLRGVPWYTYPLIVVSAAVLAIVPGIFLGLWLWDLLSTSTLAPDFRIGISSLPVVPVMFVLYLVQIRRFRTQMRKAIAEGFRGDRLPFCFECGYDLRGTSGETCPECGGHAGDENLG